MLTGRPRGRSAQLGIVRQIRPMPPNTLSLPDLNVHRTVVRLARDLGWPTPQLHAHVCTDPADDYFGKGVVWWDSASKASQILIIAPRTQGQALGFRRLRAHAAALHHRLLSASIEFAAPVDPSDFRSLAKLLSPHLRASHFASRPARLRYARMFPAAVFSGTPSVGVQLAVKGGRLVTKRPPESVPIPRLGTA